MSKYWGKRLLALTCLLVYVVLLIYGSSAFTALAAGGKQDGSSNNTGSSESTQSVDFIIESGTLVKYVGSRQLVFVPDSVSKIDKGAFDGVTVESIILPVSVEDIPFGAFANVTGLRELIVAPQNPIFSSIAGVLFIEDGTILHTYPLARNGSEYLLSSIVVGLGDFAFSGAVNLTALTAPDNSGLTVVNALAFSNSEVIHILNKNGGVIYNVTQSSWGDSGDSSGSSLGGTVEHGDSGTDSVWGRDDDTGAQRAVVDFVDSVDNDSGGELAAALSYLVFVDGVRLSFDAYRIGDSHYFRLREIGAALATTDKRFGVDYVEGSLVVNLVRGSDYVANGLEFTEVSETQYGFKTDLSFTVDGVAPAFTAYKRQGVQSSFTVYTVGGSNYFKLRDLAAVFDFHVEFLENAIRIDTGRGYKIP